MKLPRYTTIEKYVGETPLIAVERLRREHNIPEGVPLAYAGRLDPMASGKLLVLVGDECKRQKEYHGYDKKYIVEVLLGAHSDTGDVLGIVKGGEEKCIHNVEAERVVASLRGKHTLPYPHFSSKTVGGKPLHVWTLEKRLHEIEIPKISARIHAISFLSLSIVPKCDVLKTVREKIETIPKVTDPKKALGEDFRRDEVRASWKHIEDFGPNEFSILRFECTVSSGTYMRTLAEMIGEKLGTKGLAYSIHRTHIGTFYPLLGNIGVWARTF